MTNKLVPTSILAISDSTRTREEEFGLLVVSRIAPAVCLNPDAITLWNLCDGKNTLKTIIDKLTDGFTLEEKLEAERKILCAVDMLVNFNLLTIKN